MQDKCFIHDMLAYILCENFEQIEEIRLFVQNYFTKFYYYYVKM